MYIWPIVLLLLLLLTTVFFVFYDVLLCGLFSSLLLLLLLLFPFQKSEDRTTIGAKEKEGKRAYGTKQQQVQENKAKKKKSYFAYGCRTEKKSVHVHKLYRVASA